MFGRLFDRVGIGILVPLTLVSALFAPLVFLGGSWPALVGVSLWGVGMGVHESIVPAAVAPMVPVQRRASAYGLFTAGYGVAWFLGSAAIGGLYTVSRGPPLSTHPRQGTLGPLRTEAGGLSGERASWRRSSRSSGICSTSLCTYLRGWVDRPAETGSRRRFPRIWTCT